MSKQRRLGRVATTVIAAVLGIAAAVGLAGCESNKPVETNRVVIRDSRYNPPIIKVRVADTVTFKNEDNIDHTVTADNFTTPNQVLAPGGEMGFVPGEPLELLFHCEIHKFRGKMIVVPQGT